VVGDHSHLNFWVGGITNTKKATEDAITLTFCINQEIGRGWWVDTLIDLFFEACSNE
jgi:hypothetical protein